MSKTAKLSQDTLRQFRSTERWYRHALNPNILLTDGAKHVADHGDAHWLLDIIAFAQILEKQLLRQPFQVWALLVRPDRSATITVEDGNYNLLWSYKVPFTDFPVEGVTLWYSQGVIYLPSER
jgi:hypothetical protein